MKTHNRPDHTRMSYNSRISGHHTAHLEIQPRIQEKQHIFGDFDAYPAEAPRIRETHRISQDFDTYQAIATTSGKHAAHPATTTYTQVEK